MSPNRPVAFAVFLLALGAPLPLWAQDGAATGNDFALACSFARECVETEPCADTDFELSVAGRLGGLGAGVVLARATLGTVAGDVDTFGTRGGDTLFLQGGDAGSRHYLTVTGGAARYTVHMGQGPAVIRYFGTCE